MLHFAYGSNMHRAVMRKHAPDAIPLGVARLDNYRFMITADGYASIEPHRRACVYGLLWRIAARGRVTLDLWENTAAGLYRSEMLPVMAVNQRHRVLVYVARWRPAGVPRPGYMEIIVQAARELELPADYITRLECWLPKRTRGAGHRSLGEFA